MYRIFITMQSKKIGLYYRVSNNSKCQSRNESNHTKPGCYRQFSFHPGAIFQYFRADTIIKTITADNGTGFHGYKEIEEKTGVRFYFCTPYHSWERGTNENTNGLIRQYLLKGESMASLTQRKCNRIATNLTHVRENDITIKHLSLYL